MSVALTPELLARYDQPGPRYTSYPTAVEFATDFGAKQYGERLDVASHDPSGPLSLYVHLPFCEARCSFCGCHVVVARRQSVADAYLGRVLDEARIVAERLGERRTLVQYHWGGGTPTYYTPDDLGRLHRGLLEHFELDPGAEVGIEVDPRVTTVEHLDALRASGFNRISLGVQDLDPQVQDMIGRHQTWEQTDRLHRAARDLGYPSINMDLIYGLPGQTEATWAETLDQVLEMRPDRLAVYSFAYVPWVRPNQKRIDRDTLPDRDLKYALLSMVSDRLVAGGYQAIGMDHFALPDDELAVAQRDGTLSRNFMGYTTKRGTEMVALGSSGISDVAGAYAQNHKRLASYYDAIDRHELPIERGVRLSPDDQIRRFVITELMCNGVIRSADVESRFEVGFAEYFAPELSTLAARGGAVDQGLATLSPTEIRATELGSVFIRNVAMTFDAYMATKTERPVFSRTV